MNSSETGVSKEVFDYFKGYSPTLCIWCQGRGWTAEGDCDHCNGIGYTESKEDDEA